MTFSAKHAFHSSKSDGGDATKIQPSNWNDEHALTCATDKLLGRTSSGTGAVEEISISDFMQSLLSASNLAALLSAMGMGGFTTGDFKPTLKTTADAGWVMMDDHTIGDASSNATTRANADTSNLYTLIWTNVSNTYAPIYDSSGVVSTRGASAAADFAAHKQLALTKTLGRALASAGGGSGLTSRSLGQTLGEETHTLTQAELPNCTFNTSLSITDPTIQNQGTYKVASSNNGITTNQGVTINNVLVGDGSSPNASITNPTITGSVTSGGSGTAHNVMQPTTFVNFMIKL